MDTKDTDKIKKFKDIKKKKKSKLPLVLFLIVLLIVITILIFKIPYFNVSNIIVEGNSFYISDEIIKASSIDYASNVFGQVLFIGNKNILKLPYIESAKVSFVFPNTVKIKVEERTSSYYAYDKEKKCNYRIDKNGYILELAEERLENEIILIGFTFDENVIFGEKVNEVDLNKLEIYNIVKDAYDKSSIKLNITKVTFENSLTTITLNDKLSVVFPNTTNLKYNIAFLEGIIKNIGEDSTGIIDLNKENPTFSNF